MRNEIEKLKALYEEALQTTKLEPLFLYMESKIRPYVDYFLDVSLEDLHEDHGLQEELRTIIQSARLIYTFSGMESTIPDTQYDILCEKLNTVSELEEEFTEPVMEIKDKGYHLYQSLRGTLDKVYYLTDADKKKDKARKSLDDWIRSSERKIKEETGEGVSLRNEYVYVFPKWDGVSVVLEYDEHDHLKRALTRGYTKLNEALIVTDRLKEIAETGKNPFKNGKPYGIKIEAMTTLKDLTKYNNADHPEHPYKNTRAFASAIITDEKDDDDLFPTYLKCIPLRSSYMSEDGESLQILDPDVFKSPHLYCKLSEIDKIEAFCDAHHFVNGLRCDGAVIYLINPKYQKILGRKDNKQKFEVAYKFTEECQYGKVKDIEFSVGLYGTITPILEIEPLVMKGNTISHISLGSIGKLNSLYVGKGDVIKVFYDIIPVCEFDSYDPKCKRSDHKRFKVPEICPICGSTLEILDYTAKCINPRCPSRQMGRIKSHIQRMRIQYIGDSMIEQLFRAGIVKDIPDLYKWKKNEKEITSLENIGKKMYKRILKQIERVEEEPITESQLFASLCIERLSSSTFDKIFAVMDMDDLMHIVEEEEPKPLTKIPGIGDKTADWIIDGLNRKQIRKTLDFLRDHLTVTHVDKDNPAYTIVFTSFGVNDERKDMVRKIVKSQGGVEEDKINKHTTFLIVPSHDIQSRKTEYAKIHGIPVFTAEEFVQRIIPKE